MAYVIGGLVLSALAMLAVVLCAAGSQYDDMVDEEREKDRRQRTLTKYGAVIEISAHGRTSESP